MTVIYIILLLLAMLIPIKLYSLLLGNEIDEKTRKKCPFCDHMTLKEASKCNHCGHYFFKRHYARRNHSERSIVDASKSQIEFEMAQAAGSTEDFKR